MQNRIQVIDPANQSIERIRSFVNQIKSIYMFDHPLKQGERRAEERIGVTMPVSLTQLDDELNPEGCQHQAITRDISSNGVGLVMSNPIREEIVLLTLDPLGAGDFSVLAKVVNTEDLGYYYQVGLEFLILPETGDSQ